MKKFSCYLAMLCLLFAYSIPTQADNQSHEYSLSPTDDVFMRGSTAYNNSLLRVEPNSRTSYLKFDLSSIKGDIHSAKLQLTVGSDNGNGQICAYYGKSNSWSEKTINKYNAPQPGKEMGAMSGTFSTDKTYTLELNPWLLSNTTEYSIVLVQKSGNDVSFLSKESGSKHVKLVISTKQVEESISISNLASSYEASNTFKFHAKYYVAEKRDVVFEMYSPSGQKLASKHENILKGDGTVTSTIQLNSTPQAGKKYSIRVSLRAKGSSSNLVSKVATFDVTKKENKPTDPLPSDLEIGDRGFVTDTDCLDSRYPDMKIWAKAGVEDGIPTDLKVKKTISSGDNIQSAINSVSNGVVLLKNGTYRIYSPIELKSNVVLRGESRNGVKISVKMKQGEAIKFSSSVHGAGLENLKVVNEYLNFDPVAYRKGLQDGAYCKECFQNDQPSHDLKLVRIDGKNNWLDKVDLMKSGSDPVELNGDHNTVRNSLIDNCYNKGGGGEGYFDLRGDYNLVVGTTVRLIRHFAIQQKAKYNVVINNRLEVDINFHNKDLGHHLIEGNTIIRPSWHAWGVFATGGAKYGHTPPGEKILIYNNTCYDYREKRKEWDGDKIIYTYKGYGDPSKTSWPLPKCGTFYAVKPKGNIPTTPPTTPPTTTSEKTVELSPINDAYLQGYNGYNSIDLKVQMDYRKSYLSFDLSKISGEISKIQLKMVVGRDAGKGRISVYKAKGNSWSEKTINTQNAPKQDVWLGALGNADYNFFQNKSYYFNLREEYVNSGEKLSLLLKQVEGTNDVWFASKENSASGSCPKLIVTYKTGSNKSSTIGDLYDSESKLVSVFPNPLEDLATINAGDKKITFIKVYNPVGELVFHEVYDGKQTALDIDFGCIQDAGVLFMIVGHEQGVEKIKIIKN